MKLIFAKIFFAFFLAATVGSIFLPSQVAAQIPVIDSAVVGTTNGTTSAVTSAAAKELVAKTTQTTAINLVLNNPADKAALTTATSGEAVCQGIDKAEKIAKTSDQVGNFSLIGGSQSEAVSLGVRISALQSVLTCREATLLALNRSSTSTLSVVGAQNYAKKQNELSAEITTLKSRIENLTAQQKASVKDVLRAVMVKIILNLNKNLTTQLVNKLVDKYKISSYLEYGDALASQVYSLKYINENFKGDARQQLMVRSVMQSSLFPEKIKTAQAFAVSKAQEYTAEGCKNAVADYNASDQASFWDCIAKLGNENSSATYQFLKATDQASQAEFAGRQASAQEISQSNGYAPPRDCSGSLAQQRSIDSQVEQTTQAVTLARQVLTKLQDSNAAASEIAKAQADLQKALQQQSQYISQLNSTGSSIGKDGKINNGAIIDICKAIDSPSTFVANGIESFLKKHLDQAADLKSDNLPFYANFLADVASNFLTNILTGGKKTSQVLKEAGVGALNGAIIGITSQGGSSGGGTSGGDPQQEPELQAYITPKGATSPRNPTLVPGSQYSLNIVVDLKALQDKLGFFPEKVTVRNGRDSSISKQFTLSAADLPKKTLLVDFTVQTGQTSDSFVIEATHFMHGADAQVRTATVSYTIQSSTGSVQGASTILPRGPQVSLRGN